MLATIKLLNRKYYVREGHTTEQIVESFVKQINDDESQLFFAEMTGKESFKARCPAVALEYELRFD